MSLALGTEVHWRPTYHDTVPSFASDGRDGDGGGDGESDGGAAGDDDAAPLSLSLSLSLAGSHAQQAALARLLAADDAAAAEDCNAGSSGAPGWSLGFVAGSPVYAEPARALSRASCAGGGGGGMGSGASVTGTGVTGVGVGHADHGARVPSPLHRLGPPAATTDPISAP